MIYAPAEDSFMLSNYLHDYLKSKPKNISILDMGSGTGIQAETCLKAGMKNILCADINPEAVNLIKKKKLQAIQSDLFSNLPKKEKFDLIIFNPPYLPKDKAEPQESQLETTGGKKGYELSLKFLKQAKTHLNKKAEILLIASSLSNQEEFQAKVKKLGYKLKILKEEDLFFEKLLLYRICG